MKHRSYKNTNLIVWIVIILGFSFLYFSYFFVYIPGQEARLKQRAFRILKEYGSNISDKHNYFSNHFKNYVLFYGIKHYGFEKAFKNVESINKEVYDIIDDLFEVITDSASFEKKEIPDSFQIAGNQMYLQFHKKIAEKNNAKIDSLIKVNVKNTLRKNGLLINIPVNLFMDGLKFDHLFENIVLFDSLEVFYNSNEDVLIDINYPEALCDSIEGMQGGTYLKLDVRGENKHVMIMPVHFIAKKFFLAGFIPDTKYRDITRTINSQLLIFLAGILLLVLIGMPVLKVIFLSPNERLKAVDASSSVFSAVLGTGLLILLSISFIKQQFSDSLSSGSRIQLVSDLLYSNVKSDINSIKQLYCSINDLALKRNKQACSGSIVLSGVDPILSELVDSHLVRNGNFLQDSLMKDKFSAYNIKLNSGSKFLRYPNLHSPFPLNEILLVNDSGKISKAITRTPFSDLVEIDLSERNYYTNIKDTSLAWVSRNNYKYYIESIQSYNTGKGETAISFYTTAFDSAVPVLAITSVIPSLYYQVVPKDVEFLVVDDKGNVLYHSIKSKNLHENFLEECELDYRLTKAVDLRIEDKFELDYNGKKWLARILPFEDTPLFHITLIDQSPVNNKNARVFLFSFYFFVVSILLLLIAILIKRWIFPARQENGFSWFLMWLNFQYVKHKQYKKLIGLLVLSVILQVAGIFSLENPLSVLFYQFFFMVYVLYISMLVLKRQEISNKHFNYGILFILGILLIQILLSWTIDLMNKLMFLGVVFLIVVYVTKGVLVNLEDDEEGVKLGIKKKQNFYLLYLFLLLSNLAVVPVIQLYFSVKNTEDRLWQQEQMFKVANDNIALKLQYEDHKAPWFEKIQGNNIDYMKVSYESPPDEPEDTALITNSDKIYSSLYDPITKGYFPLELFKGRNYTNEWELSDSIIYTKAGKEGAVKVISGGKAGADYLLLISVIVIACILILGFIGLLLKFLATVIFNLHPQKNPEEDKEWSEVITNPENRRILLKAFNGDCYFRKSADFLYANNEKASAKKKDSDRKPVFISQILDGEVKLQEVLNSQPVIWLSGIDNYIYQIDKHESLLSTIMQVNRNSEKRVVVDLPFDIELINEYYDEYISENELKTEFTAQLFELRKRWNHVFRNYYEYNGYIDLKSHKKAEKETMNYKRENLNIDECIPELKAAPELRFNLIWANLTSKEKITLYDLADDGLLNRKNKTTIKNLIDKGLIVSNGNLKLFSDKFREYVLKQLTPSKIKTIERDLGLKGQWRNIRYLILLILIPLGAFIFMSQGISMEKIFGIIGGALAAITGLLRLFDTSTFKNSAS